MTEWHGEKAYRRCPDCRQLIQVNKTLFGSLHFCVTECEKRGHHSAATSTEVVGWWWDRRIEHKCLDCGQVVEVPVKVP